MSDLAAGRAVAAFDSASVMLRATARALDGRDFPHLGQSPLRALPVRLSRYLPPGPRRAAYAWLGAAEGIPPSRLGDVDMEAVAAWIVGQYPRRKYPGVVIGSSNGAAVHLHAGTAMPWLPQTLLIPVRWADNDADDPRSALEFGRRVADPLLDRNPDVALHHMHDGNQDRLMVRRMTYFRLKWRKLPRAYRDFLAECLAPGAAVVILDDTSTWPTTTVDDRHMFQTGAQGGLDAPEYLDGSPRVSAFLRSHGSSRSRFAAPEPDGNSPEAEWGFDAALGADVTSWAGQAGHPIVRLRTPSPQALAGPVATLMRKRVRARGGRGDRLLVESFVMLDPVQSDRTGSVPYWTFFGVGPAVRATARHLAEAAAAGDPYADVNVMVFPHGVASAGAAPPSSWSDLHVHVTGQVSILPGTLPRWPAHFDTLATYGAALRSLPTDGAEPMPALLPVREALETLAADGVDITGLDALRDAGAAQP